MDKMTAYCGLDCEKCDAYIATLNDDQALREKTAKIWSEWNHVTILPEHIRCEGCRADGAKFVYCEALCPVRQCALKEGVGTCGDCAAVDTCPTVGKVFENAPDARERLRK